MYGSRMRVTRLHPIRSAARSALGFVSWLSGDNREAAVFVEIVASDLNASQPGGFNGAAHVAFAKMGRSL